MFIKIPPVFPQNKFQEFGRLAAERFPAILSDEALNDPLQRRRNFELAEFAVVYRYRSCSEFNEEFKGLVRGASELSREWNADEEQNYKLERCVYGFFVTALSVFESFGFCLDFIGAAMRLDDFPLVAEPKKIMLRSVAGAFKAAFPGAAITTRLTALPNEPGFSKVQAVRNILAHRLAVRRNVCSDIEVSPDGMYTEDRKETLYLPGSEDGLIFSEELTQRHLDEITCLLTQLLEASVEFLQASAQL